MGIVEWRTHADGTWFSNWRKVGTEGTFDQILSHSSITNNVRKEKDGDWWEVTLVARWCYGSLNSQLRDHLCMPFPQKKLHGWMSTTTYQWNPTKWGLGRVRRVYDFSKYIFWLLGKKWLKKTKKWTVKHIKWHFSMSKYLLPLLLQSNMGFVCKIFKAFWILH